MRTTRNALLLLVGAALAADLAAQTTPPPAATEPEPAGQVEEVIVVTASRTEQPIQEAPAAISVISPKEVENLPANDFGDLLRNVPGLNVSQTSARDLNITARGSTNTLATTQLVLLDGRSIYLDFFGFVMWDFLPVNPAEIKQIEVVRGPGSAVWGANAMTGVVNLITKRPKEMVGTTLVAGAGELGTIYGGLTHAGVSGNFGYKFSAGYFEQDPYDRPTGVVPGSQPATTYPTFQNEGTKQPKGDLRLDWDLTDDSSFGAAVGYAGTSGIVHTGIGPFSVDTGSDLSYGKLDYNRRNLHVGLFGNFLDAKSKNLLTRGLDQQPLKFDFSTKTYNLDVSNTSVAGEHNIFTYGLSARTSDFTLTIAPKGTKKDEYGAFVQDEILLGEKLRWLIGGRWDHIDPVGGVFSPRTSLLFSPNPNHTFRVSYNQAFRAPSVINNYLDVTILNQVGPLLIPANADGNVELNEERMTAYEVGWVGTFDRGLMATISLYRNKTKDSIDFFVQRTYGPTNPPPVPASVLPCFFVPPGTTPLCPLGGLAGVVPSNFSYRNIGETTDEGLEFSISQRPSADWNWFFNYSYQKDPKFSGIADEADQNKPPKSRANFGFAFDNGRFFVSTNVNYQDKSYWADVLNVRAFTDSFTTVNASIGVRFLDERLTLQILGSNITDETVQQHIFGDLISRKITGQIGLRF
ncbi:MAG: TonB-dependent receptor [Thermoanaerobaculia bacterium]